MARTGRPPKAEKTAHACKQCGKGWLAYAWSKDKNEYCSRDCFYASRVGLKRETAKREERACLVCGKTFLVGGTGNRPKFAKYCSRNCARQGYWASIRKGEVPPPSRLTFDGESHEPARQMTENEIAWFAGVFDGEGCIGWPRRKVLHSVYLTVTNTCKPLIARIADVTGTGRVKEKLARINPRHSRAWVWACYGENARSILRQIHPWLIVKKEAADVALGLSQAIEPPWTQRTRTMREGNGPEASHL